MYIYYIYNIGRNMSTQLALKHREDPLSFHFFVNHSSLIYSRLAVEFTSFINETENKIDRIDYRFSDKKAPTTKHAFN